MDKDEIAFRIEQFSRPPVTHRIARLRASELVVEQDPQSDERVDTDSGSDTGATAHSPEPDTRGTPEGMQQ